MSPTTIALARLEARRLVRNPIVLAGVALSLVSFAFVMSDRVAVLQRDDVYVSLCLLPLAAAALLAVNLAAGRSDRDGTEELYGSTITSPLDRTAANVLSAVLLVAAGGLLTVCAVVYLSASGGVGKARVAELATGPLTIGVLSIAGVTLARIWPSQAAAPVGLVALAAVHLFLSTGIVDTSDPGPRVRWLALWVAPSLSIGEPMSELLIRPSGLHLAYLAALGAVCGGVAALRAEPRRATAAVTVAACVATVVLGAAQLRPPSAAEREEILALVQDPARFQVCEERSRVRYCAYEGYAGWIQMWDEVVAPVVGRVPAAAVVPLRLRVRQFPAAWGTDVSVGMQHRLTNRWAGGGRDLAARWFPGTEVYVGTSWPGGDAEGAAQLSLALAVAGWTVGLPPTARQVEPDPDERRRALEVAGPKAAAAVEDVLAERGYDACSVLGQGRAIVALWMAGQATPEAGEALRAAVAAGDSTDGPAPAEVSLGSPMVNGSPVRWGRAEAAAALRLLERPHDEVAAVVERRWSDVVAPTLQTEDALALLELDDVRGDLVAEPPPPGYYSRSGAIPCG